MERRTENSVRTKKVGRAIDRDMTTGLYMLRCMQLGLSVADLDKLEIGMVYDMIIEKQNDSYDYPVLATQEDIDRL